MVVIIISQNKPNKKARRRTAIWVLILLVIVAGIAFTLPNYVVQIVDKYNEKRNLQEQIVGLKTEQEILEKEVEQLNDTEYVAKIARQKYLFSKDGEMIIKVNSQEEQNETTANINGLVIDIDIEWIVIGAAVLSIIILSRIMIKIRKHRTRHK